MNSTFASPTKPLASDNPVVREPLAVFGSDKATPSDNAFVAYKETHRASGAWRVCVDAGDAAAAVLYPYALRLQARASSERGNKWFFWSNDTTHAAPDAPHIKFRVHVSGGQPAAIEVLFPCGKREHRVGEAKHLKFSWPAS